METAAPSSNTATLLALKRPDGVVAGLRVGQVVSATVIRQRGETAQLEFGGGRVLEVGTKAALCPGERLSLRVEHDGSRLLLRVLRDRPAADVLANALRAALPRQAPLQTLLTRLPLLLEAPLSDPLPQTLRETVRELLNRLPTPERLATADGLAGALRDSGLLLESRLAAGSSDPGHDFKGLLLRLLAQAIRQEAETRQGTAGTKGESRSASESRGGATTQVAANLRPIRLLFAAPPAGTAPRPVAPQAPGPVAPQALPPFPPLAGVALRARVNLRGHDRSRLTPLPQLSLLRGLIQQLGTALARVQTHQLVSSIAQEGKEEPAWLFEIPVHDGNACEPLRLRIRRGKPSAAGAPPSWSVTLHLQPAGWGAIRIAVMLFDGVVSAVFQAEREATSELFRGQIELLRARLREQGLQTGNLGVHTGPVASDETWIEDLSRDWLLSEKA